MSKLFLIIGGLSAAIAVLLGAFGAHGLKDKVTVELLNVFQTGVQYHFYHAIGMMIIGLLAWHLPESNTLKWSGWIMLSGIILFSGSLYIMALSGERWLGAITPLGGVAFIVSWILVVIAVIKH